MDFVTRIPSPLGDITLACDGEALTGLWFAGQALKADPFDKRSWQNAAACAFYAEDMEQMGAYVDEGLAVFPDDESLQMLRQGMLDAVKEMEAGS